MSSAPADHEHTLAQCTECGGEGIGCHYCDGRGYLRPEFCARCGEPMGNLRRLWKRSGRPGWWSAEWAQARRRWAHERYDRSIGRGENGRPT